MSLEDPQTLQNGTTQRAQSTDDASGNIRMRLRVPRVADFLPPLKQSLARTFESDIIDDADPATTRLLERIVTRGAIWSKRALRKLPCVMCFAIGAICTLLILHRVFGYADEVVVPLESARHMYPPTSPLAYRWLNGRADDVVSDHVVQARAAIGRHGNATLLVLVGRTADDSRAARDVKCSDIFSSNDTVRQYYSNLIDDAEQFLARARQTMSVCGPQLGRAVRYMAFRTSRNGVDDTNTNTTATATDGGLLHFFNPTDSTRLAYDNLDATQLVTYGVGLTQSVETQDYRYNHARGTYTLLRRTKLSIVGDDKACRRQRIGLRDALAIAAEECLDLLHGIDVRTRARRQFELGVKLNAHAFGKPVDVEI